MSGKLLAGAFAVMLACSVSTVASAAPSLDTKTDLGTLSLDDASILSGSLTNDSKFDIFTFNISGADSLSTSLRNFVISGSGKAYSFASLSAAFYKGPYTATPAAGSLLGVTSVGIDTNYLALTTGDYYAKISGVKAPGTVGGYYTLALLAGRSAAPAPGPGGALVAGAALTALFLRRRMVPKSVAA